MVYTQDEQIRRIAKFYRANLPDSSDSKTVGKSKTLTDTLLEILDSYKSRGVLFKYACSINPFTKYLEPKQLKEAYRKLQRDRLDTILPITSYTYPIQKALRFVDERVQIIHLEHKETDNDSLEIFYHDCEQFYWFNTGKLRANKSLFTKNTGGFIISEKEIERSNQVFLQDLIVGKKYIYEI